MTTKAILAPLMIAVVLASFSFSSAPVRGDTLSQQIVFAALEQVATLPLKGVSGLVGGEMLSLLIDTPQVVGWAPTVSVTGGGSYNLGDQVTITVTMNTGDDTTIPGDLRINIIDMSAGGEVFSPAETIEITGIPQAANVQFALSFSVYGNFMVQGDLASGAATSSTDVIVSQFTQTVCCTQAAPSFAGGSYISPTTVGAGGTITAYFSITNPNSFPIQVGLGMSIAPSGTGNWISDPSNDISVTISPGTNVYSRSFSVPSYASAGTYDVTLAIWDGAPGNSNRYDSTTMQGVLTVTSGY